MVKIFLIKAKFYGIYGKFFKEFFTSKLFIWTTWLTTFGLNLSLTCLLQNNPKWKNFLIIFMIIISKLTHPFLLNFGITTKIFLQPELLIWQQIPLSESIDDWKKPAQLATFRFTNVAILYTHSKLNMSENSIFKSPETIFKIDEMVKLSLDTKKFWKYLTSGHYSIMTANRHSVFHIFWNLVLLMSFRHILQNCQPIFKFLKIIFW